MLDEAEPYSDSCRRAIQNWQLAFESGDEALARVYQNAIGKFGNGELSWDVFADISDDVLAGVNGVIDWEAENVNEAYLPWARFRAKCDALNIGLNVDEKLINQPGFDGVCEQLHGGLKYVEHMRNAGNAGNAVFALLHPLSFRIFQADDNIRWKIEVISAGTALVLEDFIQGRFHIGAFLEEHACRALVNTAWEMPPEQEEEDQMLPLAPDVTCSYLADPDTQLFYVTLFQGSPPKEVAMETYPLLPLASFATPQEAAFSLVTKHIVPRRLRVISGQARDLFEEEQTILNDVKTLQGVMEREISVLRKARAAFDNKRPDADDRSEHRGEFYHEVAAMCQKHELPGRAAYYLKEMYSRGGKGLGTLSIADHRACLKHLEDTLSPHDFDNLLLFLTHPGNRKKLSAPGACLAGLEASTELPLRQLPQDIHTPREGLVVGDLQETFDAWKAFLRNDLPVLAQDDIPVALDAYARNIIRLYWAYQPGMFEPGKPQIIDAVVANIKNVLERSIRRHVGLLSGHWWENLFEKSLGGAVRTFIRTLPVLVLEETQALERRAAPSSTSAPTEAEPSPGGREMDKRLLNESLGNITCHASLGRVNLHLGRKFLEELRQEAKAYQPMAAEEQQRYLHEWPDVDSLERDCEKLGDIPEADPWMLNIDEEMGF